MQILVNLDFTQWCVEDVPTLIALKVENAPMTFSDPLRLKTAFKKVVIDITCEHKVVQIKFINQRQQKLVSFVGLSILIEVKSMSVKIPKLLGACMKEGRVSGICESHASVLKKGIVIPKILIASKSWQS